MFCLFVFSNQPLPPIYPGWEALLVWHSVGVGVPDTLPSEGYGSPGPGAKHKKKEEDTTCTIVKKQPITNTIAPTTTTMCIKVVWHQNHKQTHLTIIPASMEMHATHRQKCEHNTRTHTQG